MSGSFVQRALGYAVVVEAILVVINHAEALLHGELSVGRVGRIFLMIAVPYLVATTSIASAIHQARRVADVDRLTTCTARPADHDPRGRTSPTERWHGIEYGSDNGCRR